MVNCGSYACLIWWMILRFLDSLSNFKLILYLVFGKFFWPLLNGYIVNNSWPQRVGWGWQNVFVLFKEKPLSFSLTDCGKVSSVILVNVTHWAFMRRSLLSCLSLVWACLWGPRGAKSAAKGTVCENELRSSHAIARKTFATSKYINISLSPLPFG